MAPLNFIAWTVLVFLLGVWAGAPFYRSAFLNRERKLVEREKAVAECVDRLNRVADKVLAAAREPAPGSAPGRAP